MISQELFSEIKKKHKLPLNGVHGVAHWSRVRWNGLKLAEKNGADKKVVELFAFLHDSCRESDGSHDTDHGVRAALFVYELCKAGHIDLLEEELHTLQYACHYHSFGNMEGCRTIQTCWDADRLDLGRVGIIPKPELLCTEAARELLPEAYARSIGFHKINCAGDGIRHTCQI